MARLNTTFAKETAVDTPNSADGLSGIPALLETDTLSPARLRSDLEEFFRRFDVITRQTSLIQELDRAILRSASSAEAVLDLIVEKGREYTGSQHGQIVVVRRDKLIVQSSSEADFIDRELLVSGSLCGRAFRLGKDQHWPDVKEIPDGDYVRLHEDTKSEIAILIRPERSARVLGILNLEKFTGGPFTAEAINFARLLAGQAAIAIEQARIEQSLDLLHQVSMDLLLGEMNAGIAYDKILTGVLEALNFEHGQILIVKGHSLVILASSRKDDTGLLLDQTNSVCGRWLLAEGQKSPLRIADIQSSEYAPYYLELLGGGETGTAPMRSEMIIPLVERDHVIGALNFESPVPGAFSEQDVKLLGVAGSLLVRALSATFSRTSRVNKERIEAAQLAMTQLGNVAQSFVHTFGNHIGYVRGNLIHIQSIFTAEADSHSGTPGATASAMALIPELTEKLTEAGKVLDDLQERFNPNSPSFHPQIMDLGQVAEARVEWFVGKLRDKSIEVEFLNRLPEAHTADGKLVRASCLCELSEPVYEVVDNLLWNSAAAISERAIRSPGSGYRGVVEVEVDLPDPLMGRIRITDNGIGISREIEHKIFEYGFSTKHESGTSRGIGLWFCELYVLQRGGILRFRSREGHGTTFELLFPTNLGHETSNRRDA
jgi:GAF domain-containing protein